MNTIDLAVQLHEQAVISLGQQRLPEAQDCCERSLGILEELEGEGSPDVANVSNTLAAICDQRGEWQAAIRHAMRAERIVSCIGSEKPELREIRIQSLSLAGNVLRQRGDYAPAERLLVEALESSEHAYGPEHPAHASALNNLAVVCKYTGEFDRAEPLYGRDGRALQIVEGAHGVDSPETATIHHNLGGLEHARGRYELGEPHARKAYEIRRRARGEDHPETAADGAALAGVLDGLERYNESEPLYRQALTVFERIYGPEHYEIAVNLNNLAGRRAGKGQFGGSGEALPALLGLEGETTRARSS
jgi:tetratricopeptide (TPR) repeat protein